MSPTVKSLGIDRLTRDQRLALVQEVWHHRRRPAPPLSSDAQRQELQRRVAEDEAAPNDVAPWEDVKAHTLARLSQQ